MYNRVAVGMGWWGRQPRVRYATLGFVVQPRCGWRGVTRVGGVRCGHGCVTPKAFNSEAQGRVAHPGYRRHTCAQTPTGFYNGRNGRRHGHGRAFCCTTALRLEWGGGGANPGCANATLGFVVQPRCGWRGVGAVRTLRPGPRCSTRVLDATVPARPAGAMVCQLQGVPMSPMSFANRRRWRRRFAKTNIACAPFL